MTPGQAQRTVEVALGMGVDASSWISKETARWCVTFRDPYEICSIVDDARRRLEREAHLRGQTLRWKPL